MLLNWTITLLWTLLLSRVTAQLVVTTTIPIPQAVTFPTPVAVGTGGDVTFEGSGPYTFNDKVYIMKNGKLTIHNPQSGSLLNISITGDTINNGQVSVLNDGTTNARIKITGDSIVNTGTLLLQNNDAAAIVNHDLSIVLSPKDSILNTGTLTLYQAGGVDITTGDITNNGVLNVYGTALRIHQPIVGNGNINLFSGSLILGFDQTESNILQNITIGYGSLMLFDTRGNTTPRLVTINLASFDPNNFLGFTDPNFTYTYDGNVLTLVSNQVTVKVYIGPGYDINSFMRLASAQQEYLGTNYVISAIYYGAEPPTTRTFQPLPSPYNTTIYTLDVTEEFTVSYIATSDKGGFPTTIRTSIPWSTPISSPYTTFTIHDSTTESYVVSYFSTVNAKGGPLISSTTYPVLHAPYTTTITEKGVTHEVYYSFTDILKGNSHSTSTFISTIIPPFPKPTTFTSFSGNYEYIGVVTYYSTVNAQGGTYTASSTKTISTITLTQYKVPPVTTVTISNSQYSEVDVISYYLTQDSNKKVFTASTTISSSRAYITPPPLTSKTVDSNGVTIWAIISYYTSAKDGQIIFTSGSSVYSPPPLKTITVLGDHYVEEDVYSYFITVNGQGQIITDSTEISSSVSHDPAPSGSTITTGAGS